MSDSNTSSLLESITANIPFPHEHLPEPLGLLVSRFVLLEQVQHADFYLAVACVVLTAVAFVQLRAFSRPPPVPAKRLPKRPALRILFKPDEIAGTAVVAAAHQHHQSAATAAAAESTASISRPTTTNTTTSTPSTPPPQQRRGILSSDQIFRTSPTPSARNSPFRVWSDDEEKEEEEDDEPGTTLSPQVQTVLDDLDDDNDEDQDVLNQEEEDAFSYRSSQSRSTPIPIQHSTHGSLPDSFAPLLSSSQMEVLRQHLTADQLHAVQFKGSIRMRPGRHEIPLDKDNSRPQLVLQVPSSSSSGGGTHQPATASGSSGTANAGCRISAVAMVGSDGFTSDQDLDVTLPTSSRSKPMVKHAGLVLDPPLPLANVAPTLIHFPTLFQDNWMHSTLRARLQIVRLFFEMMISLSSFVEKCLWILESVCQIHLGKVRVTPLYKGAKRHRVQTNDPQDESENDPTDGHPPNHSKRNATPGKATRQPPVISPHWRLSLSFSGHVLLFGWIPIPFINVTLPTFIIPQPHALLDYLLSAQPLASARLRRENIQENKIALAALHTVESWQVDLHVLATPPAVSVDITLPGGVAVAMEMGLGRDLHAGRSKSATATTGAGGGGTWSTTMRHGHHGGGGDDASSINSMSSWSTTHMDTASGSHMMRRVGMHPSPTAGPSGAVPQFDANTMVPWSLELAAKGSVSREKLSVHILKFLVQQEEKQQAEVGSVVGSGGGIVESQFGARGSLAFWKVKSEEPAAAGAASSVDSMPLRRSQHRRTGSHGASQRHPELQTEDSPSVAAILLFPDETSSFHRNLRLLQYDYVFDVFEDSRLDALTVSIGATHPMLRGGTMVTTIFDSIYAYGSVTARENAILDPNEMQRKRDVLRHLPATDFQFGIQNIYIPPESESYSDDGQTLFLPELEGGRLRAHIIGGTEPPEDVSVGSNPAAQREYVAEGIKLVLDFEVPSMYMRTAGLVKEFPELDIFEGVKLQTNLSGVIAGGIRAHLRPQEWTGSFSTTGPNVFNPLEAYEIDFSRSSLSIKMKEYIVSLGHRRVVFPSESTFFVNIIESVVDMGFEGKTECELSWDFQGLSPILQVTSVGQTPADADPENKQQVSLLVAPLRQGRLSFHVSSVGGISVQKAATSREDKEGLYDWKFFNALVSPDEESAGRILDVLHDKRTMDKLLQFTKLINEDLHRILRYLLKQVWRAKEIFDSEGVSDPAHAIPMYKMTRLVSLFLTGDVEKVDTILPIVRKVVTGDGLDVVKVKELAREHIEQYEDWAPEIDRIVRWASVALGPMSASQPYVEEHVLPLAELSENAAKFQDIPSATELYESLLNKLMLPLDPLFSNTVSRVAPYLTFKQIEFILEARQPSDWQPYDLRRIRYVYSIKKKVLEIAESYGGLSFLPQSFLLSVFLGEATRSSHRARVSQPRSRSRKRTGLAGGRGGRSRRLTSSVSGTPSGRSTSQRKHSTRLTILSHLRRRRGGPSEPSHLGQVMEESPAERIASFPDEMYSDNNDQVPQNLYLDRNSKQRQETYELGDSLLGPQDVAILLQAGLTSVMKSSTAVQLNQRMLLDLICSQPRTFAVAVLAEIGTPSGQGSPRGLTSALMALLELDQSSFTSNHKIDMHALLESWLPGLKVPRRGDYMAGGRWARQSYYEALGSVANSILDDAETYMALKWHVQRVRHHKDDDPLPQPRHEARTTSESFDVQQPALERSRSTSKLALAVEEAKQSIAKADEAGQKFLTLVIPDGECSKLDEYSKTVSLYQEAFEACANVLVLDKHAFHADWFRQFYKRNYDALMIKSLYDNVIDNVDSVRYWLHALRRGAKRKEPNLDVSSDSQEEEWEEVDELFLKPGNTKEQVLVDAILDATIYEEPVREEMRKDPLVRLLIPNRPGKYDFVIISAMGVITEGKKGLELKDAFERLEKQRGVKAIRADTGTARSLEFNASKIEEAIEAAVSMKKPYGLLGYSQGCANALLAESILLSGSPKQQEGLSRGNGGLVARQLLFSASNGSHHGPAMERKIQRLIVMGEEFFKYQQGYFSRAFSSTVLNTLNDILDSAQFHKVMGGAQLFLPDGCRAFWREAQHLSDVPTCTLKGVMETHTTPESLEMLSHMLTKQSGSPLHDSQVHVYDAVGYPVYYKNRNGYLLKKCAVGEGAIQRTHHWSPLSDEVEFVRTVKDLELASFDCAKDRHVFPWVDVNARFGFIKYLPEKEEELVQTSAIGEAHPLKLIPRMEDNNADDQAEAEEKEDDRSEPNDK